MYTCWAVKDNIIYNSKDPDLIKYSLKSNDGNFLIHSSERFSPLLGYLKYSYLEEMTKS